MSQFLRPICSIVGWTERRSRFCDSKNDLSPLVQIRGARESEERKFEKREEEKKKKNDPSIHPSIHPTIGGKETEGKKGKERGEREMRTSGSNPSFSELKPIFVYRARGIPFKCRPSGSPSLE